MSSPHTTAVAVAKRSLRNITMCPLALSALPPILTCLTNWAMYVSLSYYVCVCVYLFVTGQNSHSVSRVVWTWRQSDSISLAIRKMVQFGTSTALVHRVLSPVLSGGGQWPMVCSVYMYVCVRSQTSFFSFSVSGWLLFWKMWYLIILFKQLLLCTFVF